MNSWTLSGHSDISWTLSGHSLVLVINISIIYIGVEDYKDNLLPVHVPVIQWLTKVKVKSFQFTF